MNLFESTFEKHKKLILEKVNKLSSRSERDAISTQISGQLSDIVARLKNNPSDPKLKAEKERLEKAADRYGIKNYRDQDAGVTSDKELADKEIADNPQKFKAEFWNDFKEMSVAQFVTKYKSIVADPKVNAFIMSGQKDSDNTEAFKVKKAYGVVGELIPTQNEIGFSNSLNDIIDKPKWDKDGSTIQELEKILVGDNVILRSDKGATPIITFAGKYIIDGHHRWSKICCANPKATVVCLDFKNDSIGENPELALKAFHLAIAGETKGMLTQKALGQNLLKTSPAVVEKFILENIKDQYLAVYKKYKNVINPKAAEINKEQVARYIANNSMSVSGKEPGTDTPRAYMPQVDQAPSAEDSLAKGKINFASDKVAENLFESTFNKFKNLYTK